MLWRRRKQLRAFLKQSLWVMPVFAMLAALGCARLTRGWSSVSGLRLLDFGMEGARAAVGVLVASTLTFVIFFFSLLLLSIQLASAQLSPRIIARPFQSRVLKVCLSLFVFTFGYGVAVLGRLEHYVPQFPVLTMVLLTVASIGVFLFVVEFVAKELRPVAVMARVAKDGLRVIRSVYPKPYPATPWAPAVSPSKDSVSRTLRHEGSPGVVVAMNIERLAALAIRHQCVIEMAPEVGDFVPAGAPLAWIHKGGHSLPAHELPNAIVFGRERTMEQDPAFAFRIIVDIAEKALSPAINDPTSGVLALDQLQCLLQEVGFRDLSTGAVYDTEGHIRLIYRTPDWPDFVWLAISEIRQYGRNSVQINRRLRNMLEHLIDVLPPIRTSVLQEQLDLLRAGAERGFADSRDRAYAEVADTQGLGGPLSRLGSDVDNNRPGNGH